MWKVQTLFPLFLTLFPLFEKVESSETWHSGIQTIDSPTRLNDTVMRFRDSSWCNFEDSLTRVGVLKFEDSLDGFNALIWGGDDLYVTWFPI